MNRDRQGVARNAPGQSQAPALKLLSGSALAGTLCRFALFASDGRGSNGCSSACCPNFFQRLKVNTSLRLLKLAKLRRQYSHLHFLAPSPTFSFTENGGSV